MLEHMIVSNLMGPNFQISIPNALTSVYTDERSSFLFKCIEVFLVLHAFIEKQ